MEMNNENSLLDKSMNSPMELVSRWRRKQRTVITDNSFRELDN